MTRSAAGGRVRSTIYVVAFALLIAGCGKPVRPDVHTYSDTAVKVDLVKPPAAAPAKPAPVQAQGANYLAYEYEYQIVTPAGRVDDLSKKHASLCRQAGPVVCQVLSEQTDTNGRETITARLELRADPRWLDRFRAQLSSDASSVGGRVSRTSTTSEDLTRQIVDSEAMLRSKRALRDRLQELVKRPSSGIKDLLATEEALARVQGEIDADASELAVMQGRVQMSKTTLNYQSEAMIAPDGPFAPVAAAATSFFPNLMQAVGVVITTLAFVLPFAPVIAGAVFLLLRFRKRRRSRNSSES
jgi:Domain of unknown function (DUF4349)